jgi:hypothetical protein
MIAFNSQKGLPYAQFSNFSQRSVVVESTAQVPACCALNPVLATASFPLEFASTEHLWQSLKATTLAMLMRFTREGDLGFWNAGTRLPGKNNVKFWRARSMVGIIAKCAANPAHARLFGIAPGDMNYARERLPQEEEQPVWLEILRRKYADLRALLLSTGNTMLLEFDKSAKREAARGRVVHWGGLYDTEERRLYGENVMGQYLMFIREELRLSRQ